MGKVTIKKDKNRILLTELLPYEVPMLFSNEGFFTIVSSGKINKFFERIFELLKAKASQDNKRYGIPYNFEIKKNIKGDTRTLSVIHPMNQLNFIELYEKYDSLMIHLCSKSPFSLRKISKIAKYFYSPKFVFEEDSLKNPELEVEPEILNEETRYLKSYFIYKPIDLIYKFYDRHDYQRLEQRFNYLMEFDIHRCFYNIYTHSLTWAIKDKESAKRNAGEKSFENVFDKFMQLANYNETNGIVVGPEISRIFAEIILQEIDIKVLNMIELKESYKYGIDFEIKRYVDDFFVFSNNEKLLRLIKETYQKELEKYKLYLNPSKDDVKTTPFLSDITVGKWEINITLKEFFKNKLEESEIEKEGQQIKVKIIKKITAPYKEAKYFIKDFQCIVKRNGLTYDLLSKEIIRYFKESIVKILKDDKVIKEKEKMHNFLLMYFDILFYSYSLNINANTTFKISQIIVLVCKYLAQMDDELSHAICSKIFKDADFVLTNNQRKSILNDTNIETLNLIIALKYLGKEYLLSEKRLSELFELKPTAGFSRLNYFQIITLLYYIEDIDSYKVIKENLESEIVKRYAVELDPFTKSEFTLLFFDFICCPFVGMESKRKVMRHSKYAVTNSSTETIDNKINEIKNEKRWFMDWDINIDLERVLKKKEWGSSY
jgi:hypothetical protein